MPQQTGTPNLSVRSSSPPKIDFSALPKSSSDASTEGSFENQLLKDSAFMGRVRGWLKTEEQRKLFDFIYNVPRDFALQQAGERWTEERVAEYLKIPQDRIPTLKKSLRRAFQRQLRLIHIER